MNCSLGARRRERIDPQEQLIGIFTIQILPTVPIPYRHLFEPVVYQAIVD